MLSIEYSIINVATLNNKSDDTHRRDHKGRIGQSSRDSEDYFDISK
jgi:hypothetical protein